MMISQTDPIGKLLLRLGRAHAVIADDAEDARRRIAAIAGHSIDPIAFHEAVAACVRDGTIQDPVRLEAGALQCHWRLKLTPKGVAACGLPGA